MLRHLSIFFLLLSMASTAFAADTAEQSFQAGQADSMKVIVVKLTGDSQSPVPPSTVFHAGDRIRIMWEGNFAGYIYMIDATNPGRTKLLLPAVKLPNNSVALNSCQFFPERPDAITFGPTPGQMVLRVIMSRQPLPAYQKILSGQQPWLVGKDPMFPQSPPHPTQGGVIPIPPGSNGQVRPLVLNRSPLTQATFVSAAPTPSHNGHLGSTDVGLFEIRLQHR